MGLVCPELSLELKPSYVPESINGFLRKVSSISDASERLDKVDEFVERLQDEMNKIHVFKRELPLSILLLKDAILYLKQETTRYKTRRSGYEPVLEEFIPLKRESNCSAAQEDDSKKNWMSSAQLWTAEVQDPVNSDSKKGNRIVDDDPSTCSTIIRGHVPFLHTYPTNTNDLRRKSDDKEDVSAAGLSLLFNRQHSVSVSVSRAFSPKLAVAPTRNCNPSSPASSSARKQRRCWSPELHRRFVDALTQLGGAQVATPKQIRELMRVDGLTNDEVKSHLQKYRLHTRRVPNDSGTSTNKSGQGLSGSWSGQDQHSESSRLNSSQSASPEGPLQFPGFTGGTSTTAGDSMEDEDEDDESYCWKGHVHRSGKDDV